MCRRLKHPFDGIAGFPEVQWLYGPRVYLSGQMGVGWTFKFVWFAYRDIVRNRPIVLHGTLFEFPNTWNRKTDRFELPPQHRAEDCQKNTQKIHILHKNQNIKPKLDSLLKVFPAESYFDQWAEAPSKVNFKMFLPLKYLEIKQLPVIESRISSKIIP